MDISQEYVKMCNCLEIQDNWEPRIGDFYTYYRGGDHFKIITDVTIWDTEVILKRIQGEKWLPRQDQLQAMVEEKSIRNLAKDIYAFAWQWQYFPKTWEQLWLAFVMWELHQKRWNGERWEA